MTEIQQHSLGNLSTWSTQPHQEGSRHLGSESGSTNCYSNFPASIGQAQSFLPNCAGEEGEVAQLLENSSLQG